MHKDELTPPERTVRFYDLSSITGSGYDSHNQVDTNPADPILRYWGVRDTGARFALANTDAVSPPGPGPFNLPTLEYPQGIFGAYPSEITWLNVTNLTDPTQVAGVHQSLIQHVLPGGSASRPPSHYTNTAAYFYDLVDFINWPDAAAFAADVTPAYRKFNSRWQMPLSDAVDAYGLILNGRSIDHTNSKWKGESIGAVQASEIIGGYLPQFWPGGRLVSLSSLGSSIKVETNDPWFEPFDLSDMTNFHVTTAPAGSMPAYSDPEVSARPSIGRGCSIFLVPQWWRFDITWQGVYFERTVAARSVLESDFFGPLDPTYTTYDPSVKFTLILRDFSVTGWKKAMVRPIWPVAVDNNKKADTGTIVEVTGQGCDVGTTLRTSIEPHTSTEIDDPRTVASSGPFPLTTSDPDSISALFAWADATQAFQDQAGTIPNFHNSGILGNSIRLKKCLDLSHFVEPLVIDYKFGINGTLTVTQDDTPEGHLVGAIVKGTDIYYVWRAVPTSGRATLIYNGPFESILTHIPGGLGDSDTDFRLVQSDSASFGSLDPSSVATHLLNPF